MRLMIVCCFVFSGKYFMHDQDNFFKEKESTGLQHNTQSKLNVEVSNALLTNLNGTDCLTSSHF